MTKYPARRWAAFLCAALALAGCGGVSLQSPFVVEGNSPPAAESAESESDSQTAPAPVEDVAAPKPVAYEHPATRKLLIEYRPSRAKTPPSVGVDLRRMLERRLYASGAFTRGEDLILQVSFPEFKYEEAIGFDALFGKTSGGFFRLRARVSDGRGRSLYSIAGSASLAPGGVGDALKIAADDIARRVVDQFYDGPRPGPQP